MLLKNVQLNCAAGYDTQTEIHTSTPKYNIILEKEFQNTSLTHHVKIVSLMKEMTETGTVKGIGLNVRIMSKTSKM